MTQFDQPEGPRESGLASLRGPGHHARHDMDAERAASRCRFMTWLRASLVPAATAALLAVTPACPSNNTHEDGATEAEDAADKVDTSSDADADVRDDGPPDSGPDVDIDAETDVDVRPDVDADVEEADDGDGWDADSILPTGCRFVLPARGIFNGYSGRNAIDDGKFVWRTVDSSSLPSDSVLMVRELASGADREVLRRTYPELVEKPSVHGDSAAFFSPTIGEDASSQEIYRVPLFGGDPDRLTNDTVPDGNPMAGRDHVVYRSNPDSLPSGMVGEYRYVDLRDDSNHAISTIGAPNEVTFDGYRWVAWASEHFLYKFDLSDPGAGPQQLAPYEMGITGMAFDRDTGLLITGVHRVGESDDYRLQTWNMTTGETSVLLDQPWSQVMGDVDGHVVVYDDSQVAGEPYWSHQYSELRILDRDTGVIRVVMPLDIYYGVGIWERWIAFNNYGIYGDSLIICDLVAAGYMDAELHVVPE